MVSMKEDISPPDSPFHGFSSSDVPRPRIVKIEAADTDDDVIVEIETITADNHQSPPDSPFHGFNESDVPQPIVIKTENIDDQSDDFVVVEVVRAAEKTAQVKAETVLTREENVEEVFHGFSLDDIPKPMLIKDEPDLITVERVDPTSTNASVVEETVPVGKSVQEILPSNQSDELITPDNIRSVNNSVPHNAQTIIGSAAKPVESIAAVDTVACVVTDSNVTIASSGDSAIAPSQKVNNVELTTNVTTARYPQSNEVVTTAASISVPVPEIEKPSNEADTLATSIHIQGDHGEEPILVMVEEEQPVELSQTEHIEIVQEEHEEHVELVENVEHVEVVHQEVAEMTAQPMEVTVASVNGPQMVVVHEEQHIEVVEGSEDVGQHMEVVQGEDMLVVEEEEETSTEQDHSGPPELQIFTKEEPGEFEGELHINQSMAEAEKITIIQTGSGEHETVETVETVKQEVVDPNSRLPRNIQILDESGSTILLVDKDDDSDESDMEDREFTVIVDEDGSDEEGYEEEEEDEEDNINLARLGRLPLEDKNTFEGESIEDILAQFEAESKNRAVACPNCKKCFVSNHFLNIHVSNKSTLCDLCNTQCCTAANLRTHKNLECDLSKRKRNIDLIAQETALLGRKPIEPEKYYNLPIDSSDEENEGTPRKMMRSVNDQKYECSICGQYVKILHSHMKFLHGIDDRALGHKYKCPECGVLVSNLSKHKTYRHDPLNKIVLTDAVPLEVVRCKHQGCDTFFNNTEELAEHQKRDHGDQVRLACGMGGCDAIFDSRGALRKHRTESHPELEEFKPVDLEPDDPDRDAELTVACPVCERKFKHKNTCTVHIKVHHLGWTKRKMYDCPDCMKGFDNKKNMELHREAIHLGIRTICPLCDKPVTRLDLHVRMVHTELPEWPCPDCGKKFKRKFDLNRHRVTVHLGVRNFPCDLCGKRFADMKDMTRHKNAVHYGMKIKWNSKKHKEERKRKKDLMDKKMKYREKTDKFTPVGGAGAGGSRQKVNFPVELIDADCGDTTLHIEESAGLDASSVILDPELQSQLSNVQSEAGDARVLIQTDPDDAGNLRFVVLQEEDVDESDIEIEEEAETHIILEPED